MSEQQYIYIEKWGRVLSLVTIYQKNKKPIQKYMTNETIVNLDYYAVVIN